MLGRGRIVVMQSTALDIASNDSLSASRCSVSTTINADSVIPLLLRNHSLSAMDTNPRPLTVEVSRFDGVHKVTNCRQVFSHVYPKYRVVIAERKSQKPLLCGASPLVVSFGV